jgi:hypothetical protein
MSRRISVTLGLLAASVCAVVGLSVPANAVTGPVLYRTFNFPDACSSAGYAGQQSGQWVSYYCTQLSAAGPGDSWPGLYDLYVTYP